MSKRFSLCRENFVAFEICSQSVANRHSSCRRTSIKKFLKSSIFVWSALCKTLHIWILLKCCFLLRSEYVQICWRGTFQAMSTHINRACILHQETKKTKKTDRPIWHWNRTYVSLNFFTIFFSFFFLHTICDSTRHMQIIFKCYGHIFLFVCIEVCIEQSS